MLAPFKTTFAVPLLSDDCIEDVTRALNQLDGIQSITPSLASQTLTVAGACAPSAIVSAIQSTGRDAILRGSGGSNGAAVCILHTDAPQAPDVSAVRGLARLVQVSATHTLIDLTLRGLPKGRYTASIRATGDIRRGAESTGAVWSTGVGEARGDLGPVDVDENGRGAAFLAKEMTISEIVGRGMVMERNEPGEKVFGVVAWSAGAWDNDKTVCSCSGQTVWQEREEHRQKGIL